MFSNLKVGWLLVFYAQNVYWYYLSRFLFGVVGGGGMVALPIFTAEVCSDKWVLCVAIEVINLLFFFSSYDSFSIRGVMNAFTFLINSFGSVIAFCIALYLDYRWQAIVALFIPCLFLFAFIFVPETPAYLQRKYRIVVYESKQFVQRKNLKSLRFNFSFFPVGGWKCTWVLPRSKTSTRIRKVHG